MALPGETLRLGGDATCGTCHKVAVWGVYRSGAGFYIGTYCDCGPYSRESLRYWPTREEAQEAYESGTWEAR